MRIGHGYDVHRLVEQRKLILGGVEIPFEKGLLGHSDGRRADPCGDGCCDWALRRWGISASISRTMTRSTPVPTA